MNEIITTPALTVKELGDTNLREVTRRVARTFQLAAEKAVAYTADPKAFPICTNPQCLEQIFLARFKELSDPVRSAATARLMPVIKGTQTTRLKLYGDLAAVDLHNATEICRQVKALPVPDTIKFSLSYLSALPRLKNFEPSVGGTAKPLTTPSAQCTTLECRIHKVHCWDETNSFLEPEWSGSDEIHVGGSTVDATGVVTKIDSEKVGDFNDGSVKFYLTPKVFYDFDLRTGTEWPKTYRAIFVLAEHDSGGLAKYLDDLVDKAAEYVKDHLAEIGVIVGTVTGGVIGAIIGAAVGEVLKVVVDWLKRWWGDEIFTPIEVHLSVPSLDFCWANSSSVSPRDTVTFKGHNGTYYLTYDWRMKRADGLAPLNGSECLFSAASIQLARYGGFKIAARNDLNPLTHHEWAQSTQSRTTVITDLKEKYQELFTRLNSKRDKLAEVYTQTTLWLNTFGLDFGYPQRNSLEPEGHSTWAKRAALHDILTETYDRIETIFWFADKSCSTNHNLLSMWFASESVYLAKAGRFNHSFRDSTEPSLHLNWAQSVPADKVISDLLEKYQLQSEKKNQISLNELKKFYAASICHIDAWGVDPYACHGEIINLNFYMERCGKWNAQQIYDDLRSHISKLAKHLN